MPCVAPRTTTVTVGSRDKSILIGAKVEIMTKLVQRAPRPLLSFLPFFLIYVRNTNRIEEERGNLYSAQDGAHIYIYTVDTYIYIFLFLLDQLVFSFSFCSFFFGVLATCSGCIQPVIVSCLHSIILGSSPGAVSRSRQKKTCPIE